ncbi:MAG: amidohydrolase [Granulosicoccus sp.]
MIHYDCHAHVYEHINAIKDARYIPTAPAPLSFWRQQLQKYKLKGGVLVQVSFLGTNNTELCSALAQLDSSKFAGVAVVSPDITEQEIDRLFDAGVRGFRWNLVQGAAIPALGSLQVKQHLNSIRERDMHIELHLESSRLAQLICPLLDTGVTVVVDHFGLPAEPDASNDPWIQAITDHKNLSRLYVKFSAPYRTPFDTLPHALAIQSRLLPDHVIWGSDWPHTQHESTVEYSHVAMDQSALPIKSDHQAVYALYGLQ